MPESSIIRIKGRWFLSAVIMFVVFGHALLVTIFVETLQATEQEGVYLNEIGIGTGYARGSLKGNTEKLSTYPAFVRFGFNANSLFGIERRGRMLQLVCEPLVNTVSGPQDGVEIGCGFGIRYLHDLCPSMELVLEASAAPIYYSIDTVEQGSAGFNFLDQLGVGLRYRFSLDKALFGGYRWRHISHADLADRRNSGINSTAVIFGFSWLY